MTIGEVIEMLKEIFAIIAEIFGGLFNKEEGEEKEDKEDSGESEKKDKSEKE